MRRPPNNFSVKSGVCTRCQVEFTFALQKAKYCDSCREHVRLERKRKWERGRKRKPYVPRKKVRLIPYVGYDGGGHG